MIEGVGVGVDRFDVVVLGDLVHEALVVFAGGSAAVVAEPPEEHGDGLVFVVFEAVFDEFVGGGFVVAGTGEVVFVGSSCPDL